MVYISNKSPWYYSLLSVGSSIVNPGGVHLAVGGEFNELLNITRNFPTGANLVPDSGIYMCEACTDRGTQSEECHTANVTLFVIGGPPVFSGKFPFSMYCFYYYEYI